MGVTNGLRSEGDLREIYAQPSERSLRKQLSHLDEHCRAFIAHSPLLVMATTDGDGNCDVSPKGGPPGFVTVLDEHRLAIPDLAGNNRLDSMRNIVADGGVGLLFMIPGLDETLRVNGHALITTDEEILDACALVDVKPRAAIVVEVREAFIHCAKAFRRARAWQPDAWPDRSDLPSAGCMLRDHIDSGMTVEESERYLEESYRTTLWRPGGMPRPAG